MDNSFNNQKVALLFLTRQDLNHPQFWQRILTQHQDLFNLYIHSKFSLHHSFFQSYRLPESQIVETTYLNHIKAWQALIREALKDASNTRFIFLSESCTPLYPLNYLYQHLMQTPDSYMRYSAPWWDRSNEREVTELPMEHRWANAEWVILNRKHAELIAEDQTVIDIVSRHPHDQESYIASLLSLKGCLNEVVYQQTTYASFMRGTDTHPYEFTEYSDLNLSYIDNAKQGCCLFARKLMPEFPEDKLKEIMEERLLNFPTAQALQKLTPFSLDQVSASLEKLKAKTILDEMSLANSCAIFPFLIRAMNLEIGYEIGVSSGLHLQRALAQTTAQIYGVDPYEPTDTISQIDQNLLYLLAQEWISPFKERSQLKRISSKQAALQVQDQSIDFVFIHGLYMPEVQKELELWYPKVRPGGLIAGYYRTDSVDVFSQVTNFFNPLGLNINFEKLEKGFWWAKN